MCEEKIMLKVIVQIILCIKAYSSEVFPTNWVGTLLAEYLVSGGVHLRVF